VLKGVLLVRFDSKLGPIPEGMFPQDFIDRNKIPEITMQIWANLPKAGGNGYTLVNFNKINLFGFLLYDEDGNLGPYCIASFFDSDAVAEIWGRFEDIKKLMEIINNKIKEKLPVQVALQELYENIMKIITRPIISGVLKDNVYSTFKEVFENLAYLISTIKNIKDEDIKKKMIEKVKNLSENLLTLSILWGGREIATLLIKRLLSSTTTPKEKLKF